MKIRLIAIFLVIVLSSLTFYAQRGGSLKVHQSEEIAELVEKHKKINAEKKQMNGYRVQIYSVSGVKSREKAQEVLDKFTEQYPDGIAYIVYSAPYYRVRLGDFRTQIEALYYLQSIVDVYPYAFPVKDYINYPTFH
jgi:hypothetical protein